MISIRQIGFAFVVSIFALIAQRGYTQPDLEFYRYPTDKAPGAKMHSVYKDQLGYLWIGKPDGLLRHDGINFDLYTHDSRDSGSISNNNVRVVFQDSKQRLWVGTFTGGLCLFDYTDETFKKYSIQTDIYPGATEEEGIWVIFEDIDNNIWIGTRHHGLQILDEKSKQFTAYLPDGIKPGRIEYHTVRSAIPHKNDPYKYWIGTRRALFEFDLKTRKFEKHEIMVKRYDADSAATVYSITEDTDSTVLTGGWGEGLLRYNFKKRTFEQFQYREVLSSANIVFDIFKIDDSNVLLGTGDRALIHYNLENGNNYWYAYDESRSNRSWRGQTYDTYLDNTGRIWMAQAHGFTSFRLYEDTTSVDIRAPCIHSIHIDNEPLESNRSLNHLETWKLKDDHNFISIGLGDFQLEPEFEHEFQYKMSGLFDSWRKANSNMIEIQNLNGGDYQLEIRSRTKNGDWSEIKRLGINVTTPFWKRWWFIALGLLTIGSFILLGHRYRINQVKQEERLKSKFQQQLNEVQLNALRAQMNPHFLFNCLNSINKYIISNKPKEASEYLTKFSWLMRLILQNSKNKFVLLEDEIETLEIYVQLEQQRFGRKFEYKINTPDDHSSSTIKIPPLLLQPYVENAIWHGLMHKEDAGKLLIDLKLEDGDLICIIEDDGVGRRRSALIKSQKPNRKKSMGTDITQNRITLINKLYDIEANVRIEDLSEDSGTRVIITLPQEN